MTDAVVGVAVPLAILTGIWFLAGRPGQRTRRAPRDRFMSLPKYDRGDNLPGWLLGIQATWVLTTLEWVHEYGVLVVVFVIAVLSAKSNLMSAGLGLISSTALILDRIEGGADCVVYSVSDQVAFYVGAVLTVAVLLGLALALKPFAIAGKFLTPPIRLPGGGRAKKPSMFAAVALSTFGALDLLDLATRPGVVGALGEWTSATLSAAIVLIVALAFLAWALTVMPSFTLSVLGAGTLFAAIVIDGMLPSGCIDWWERALIALVFFVGNQIAARLRF